jgi:hypothetical protein
MLCSAQGLANTAWAFSTARHPAPRLMAALGEHAARRADEFNAQDVAHTARAFALAGPSAYDAALFDALAGAASLHFRHFDPRSLVSIAWAFATVAHPAPRLLARLAQSAADDADAYSAPGLVVAAWARHVTRPCAGCRLLAGGCCCCCLPLCCWRGPISHAHPSRRSRPRGSTLI